MSFLYRIVAGLRTLLDRSASDVSLEEEVTHFYAEAEAEQIANGASPNEARRRVRLEYGDKSATQENVRGFGWESIVEALVVDVRIAMRRLRTSPGFTAVVVLTLALGIGSATAIYSVVRPALFAPLDYPDPDQIVSVMDRGPDGSPIPIAFGTYVELAERTRVFDALAVSRPWQPITNEGDQSELLQGLMVSAQHFDVLDVPPAMGAGFDSAEDRPGGAALVLLGDRLWRRLYGADRAIIGASVRLNDRPYEVVGVLPPGFQDVTAPSAQVWTLLQYDRALPSLDGREWGHHLNMIGRVSPSVNVDGARRAITEVAFQPLPDFFRPEWSAMDQGFNVRPLREASTADVRATMLALVGAVALLLAIACANVTVLLLAWGARRQREFAVRVVLGAGRGRLIRQLLVESTVLAAAGGTLALVVTRLSSAALGMLVPTNLQPPGGTTVDGNAFAFAFLVTSAIGIVVGLAPALTLSKDDLRTRMSRGGRSGHRRARRGLVVTEVALALVLLVGSGLLMRSVSRLFSTPVGLDAEGLVVMQIHTFGLDGNVGTQRFFDQVLDAVRREPGVMAATLTTQLPLSGEWHLYGVAYEDLGDRNDVDGAAALYAVEPGYIEAMGIPLLAGRELNQLDVAGAPRSVIVSESMANRSFGDQNPIGRRMHIGRTDMPWQTVVGVVGDVKQESLGSNATEAVYVTSEQWYDPGAVRWIAVRVAGGAAAVTRRLRRAVQSVDSRQAVLRVERMDDLVKASESQRRFVLTVLKTFAGMALLLATIGLYGVMSRSVAERRHELGVRAALGATRQGIVGLVVRQGLMLTLIGVSVGTVVAAGASRALGALLFEISPLDPTTYAATALVLLGVALVACLVPAIRAGGADPLETLKAE